MAGGTFYKYLHVLLLVVGAARGFELNENIVDPKGMTISLLGLSRDERGLLSELHVQHNGPDWMVIAEPQAVKVRQPPFRAHLILRAGGQGQAPSRGTRDNDEDHGRDCPEAGERDCGRDGDRDGDLAKGLALGRGRCPRSVPSGVVELKGERSHGVTPQMNRMPWLELMTACMDFGVCIGRRGCDGKVAKCKGLENHARTVHATSWWRDLG